MMNFCLYQNMNQASPMLRNKFTPDEDKLLKYYVNLLGTKSWKQISYLMPNRTMRQCRERWKYFLSPDSSNSNQWSVEEDDLLISQYQELGPQWSKMAHLFKGRSGVSLKNRFHLLERNNFVVMSDNESTPDVTSSSDDESGFTLKTRRLELPCSIMELDSKIFSDA